MSFRILESVEQVYKWQLAHVEVENLKLMEILVYRRKWDENENFW